MDFFMKLPRNKKEFALFIGIVSVLSVNTIAPLITCFDLGFNKTTWITTLQNLCNFILCGMLYCTLHCPSGNDEDHGRPPTQ